MIIWIGECEITYRITIDVGNVTVDAKTAEIATIMIGVYTSKIYHKIKKGETIKIQ